MQITLGSLDVGASARVVGYSADTDYCARLIRLGLIPGTRITLKRRAPLGDPVQIQFRGYSLVLRPAEARDLVLEPLEAP
jgi:Fe2+ transport system protein FeoA